MNYRKILLAIMLGALALAALGGAGEMLLGGRDKIWIVASTGILTAVACGLLMLIGRLFDSPKARHSGLLLTVSLIICYLLVICIIWMQGTGRVSELVGMTALAIALASLPAAFFMYIARVPGNRLAGYVGLIASAIAPVLMVIGNWLDFVDVNYWQADNSGKWWTMGGTIAASGILAGGSLAGFGRRRPWRWVGVLAAIGLTYLVYFEIWASYPNLDAQTTIVASIAAFIAYLNVALLCELKPGQGWLMAIAVAATGATLAAADARSLFTGTDSYSDSLDRLVGALGIFSGCATLAMLIVVRITRKTRDVAAPVEFKEVSLTCPSCSAKQTLPIGEAACGTCGLRIFMRLEMPRCPKCDYALLMNQSDRCPECGTELRPNPPAPAVLEAPAPSLPTG